MLRCERVGAVLSFNTLSDISILDCNYEKLDLNILLRRDPVRHRLVALIALVSLCVAAVSAGMQSPTVFKKLDFFIHTGDEADDQDAQLVVDPQRSVLIFADEDNASRVFATVDFDRITGVTYENSKHARITAGLLIAWPLLFLKGRKHWLTVTFGPSQSGEVGGYVYARMDKSNYQAILAAINGFTGYEIRRIQEGGEVSVLYPGVRPTDERAEPRTVPSQATTTNAPAATVAQPADKPSRQPTSSTQPADTVQAAPLPDDSEKITAAAPPTPAADLIQPPTFRNNGVQWTERSGGRVGFVWAAEVENPNTVEIGAAVTVCLRDASGAIIHKSQEQLVAPPGKVTAFTATGEMEESVALRADHWSFDVMAVEPQSDTELETEPQPDTELKAEPQPHTELEAEPPPASLAVVGDSSPPVSTEQPVPLTTEQPVPLTPDIVLPRLIAESVQIVIEDLELQKLNLAGKVISLRCLVQTDGTVGDSRVLNIDPPISLKAGKDALTRSVERSARLFWRFSPATRAGVPVPVWYTFTIRYEPAG